MLDSGLDEENIDPELSTIPDRTEESKTIQPSEHSGYSDETVLTAEAVPQKDRTRWEICRGTTE